MPSSGDGCLPTGLQKRDESPRCMLSQASLLTHLFLQRTQGLHCHLWSPSKAVTLGPLLEFHHSFRTSQNVRKPGDDPRSRRRVFKARK